MTADQVKGKGFRGALRYNLQKVEQGKAEVLDSSFANAKEATIMQEVGMVRMLRPNLAKYFYHTSLNFPVGENLPNEQMNQIANEYLNQMGFDQHQYMVFRHYDADHPHLHLLVNRIGYDGTVVSDSNDYKRSEQVLRALEKQYGLTEVISSRQAQERAMTKNELEMMQRTDEPSIKMKLQVTLKSILNDKSKLTTTGFISALEAKGINVLFNQASTGFVSGISYGYEDMQFKGAHLGNSYKWSAIQNTISYEQERDRTAIHQANVRTRAGEQFRAGVTGANSRQQQLARSKADPAADTALAQADGGKLQTAIRKAGQRDELSGAATGITNGQHGLSDANDSQQHRKGQQATKQDRHEMDHQNLPDSDLIGHLLRPVYDGGDMVPKELRQNKRKRKKKRGLSL